jgi:hypothetical protein
VIKTFIFIREENAYVFKKLAGRGTILTFSLPSRHIHEFYMSVTGVGEKNIDAHARVTFMSLGEPTSSKLGILVTPCKESIIAGREGVSKRQHHIYASKESIGMSNRKVCHRFTTSSSTISIPNRCQNLEEKGYPAMRCTTLSVAPVSDLSIAIKEMFFQQILLRLDTVLH